jgi:hypothetical protein
MIDIPPQISFIIFFIWLVLFIAGQYQLKKIKEHTVKLVVGHVDRSLQKNPDLSVDEYFEYIFPFWEDEVKKYWFIPHKSELFPIRVSTENLVKRINFTPEWVGAYLDIKEIHIKRTKLQEKRIKEIISLNIRK